MPAIPDLPKPRGPLISLLLLLYVTGMTIVAAPPSAFKSAFVQKFKPFFNYCGLLNHYQFFAPDPLDENIHLSTVVRFVDQSEANWDFPRFVAGKTKDLEHQRGMPFFFWQYNMIVSPENAILWPDACRYAARANKRPDNPPESVLLVRDSDKIPIPYFGLPRSAAKFLSRRELMFYRVKQEDLQ